MGFDEYLDIDEEVRDTLARSQAVVALESTIITHGMPYPQNLDMALSVESEVREHGAIPATIAIMDGRLKVGVAGSDLEQLAELGHTAAKASRRDLSSLIVSRQLAGTTVATTMQIAAASGIKIFATGGIGGVHRGAEQSFDISADLEELGRTQVAVVCAGAKSILDIGKTLEVLETNGVPVLGFQSDNFPAFYTRESGHGVDHRFDYVAELAKVIEVQFGLNLGGILVANPILEKDAMPQAEIEAIIARAVAEAELQNITRKALTPFLLQKIFELTNGDSLVANIALVKNNARVAAQISVAMSALQ